MFILTLVLLILAGFCFLLSAVAKPDAKWNLLPLGLLFWVLVPICNLINSH